MYSVKQKPIKKYKPEMTERIFDYCRAIESGQNLNEFWDYKLVKKGLMSMEEFRWKHRNGERPKTIILTEDGEQIIGDFEVRMCVNCYATNQANRKTCVNCGTRIK